MEEKFSRQAAKFAKKKYIPEAKTPLHSSRPARPFGRVRLGVRKNGDT
jgi:hypothetical protein